MNMPQHQQPYVGTSAFAHKAGLHTSAIARRPDSYEHVTPGRSVTRPAFIGDLSGRASVELKAEQLGIELEDQQMVEVVEEMKRLEHEGYHFEVADASLELMMRRQPARTSITSMSNLSGTGRARPRSSVRYRSNASHNRGWRALDYRWGRRRPGQRWTTRFAMQFLTSIPN